VARQGEVVEPRLALDRGDWLARCSCHALIRRLMDDDFNGMIKSYLRRRVYRRLTDETDIA
jgi:hypothetical protein